MKKSIELVLKKLGTLVIIIGLSTITFSCGDDEKFDCDASEDKIEDLFDDYFDAYDDEDCDEMEELSEKIIAEIKKAKNCDYVDDAIDDIGLDDFDELMDYFEDNFENDADYWGC